MAIIRRGGAGWSIHPGEILREEFLRPMGLSEYALAKALGVNAQRVNDIVKNKTGISAEMAILMGRYFGTTPEFWMNLQSAYELGTAKSQKSLKNKLKKIAPYEEVAA